jgi:hypothetical protein
MLWGTDGLTLLYLASYFALDYVSPWKSNTDHVGSKIDLGKSQRLSTMYLLKGGSGMDSVRLALSYLVSDTIYHSTFEHNWKINRSSVFFY